MTAGALRIRALAAAVAICIVGLTRPAHAVDGAQMPELALPQRGSVAGEYGGEAFNAGQLSRGAFNLPAPCTAPETRGPLLAQVFPTYSIDASLSEWGQGWHTSLVITRWRPSGDLDYATDDLMSPWGRLRKGGDGDWYPDGLPTPVRMETGPNDTLVAYLPDGEQMTFGGAHRVVTPLGTYAWLLVSAQNAAGQKTSIDYEVNASNRSFVTTVSYGGWGDDYQYQIAFQYEPLSTPITSYAPGIPYVLDRRVTSATVTVKNATTGTFGARWGYTFHYLPATLGPGFFLKEIDQTFASGQSPPPVTYSYYQAADQLHDAQFAPVDKLSAVLTQYGPDLVQPDGSTVLDIDHDGRPDMEERTTYSLLTQQDTQFASTPLSPAPNAYAGCLPPPSDLNPPRNLAQLRNGDDSFQVVDLEIGPSASQTTMYACNREGSPLGTWVFEGNWTLGPTTRLVDLNRDHQPDLLAVFAGQYAVLPNTSSPQKLAFGTVTTGSLSPSFQPQAIWVQDFNGDGLADLIARSDSSLTVWYGTGRFQFIANGQVFDILQSDGLPVTALGAYQVQFFDANRDGLTDLLLTSATSAQVFVNTGLAFTEVVVPALQVSWNADTGQPVAIDFAGTGNTQVLLTNLAQAESISLDSPQVALLETADDGRGTVLTFAYQRSLATPGSRQRQSVLSSLTVASSGYDAVTYSYAFGSPYLHSSGQFLLGYQQVSATGPTTATSSSFFFSDDISGELLSEERSDTLSPGVVRTATHTYDSLLFQGIPWMRPHEDQLGWTSSDSTQTAVETTEYLAFEADFCPSQVLLTKPAGTIQTVWSRSNIDALSKNLHCLVGHEVQTGTHTDAELNFRHEQQIDRNPAGLVQTVTRLGALGAWVVQRVDYNSDNTIHATSSPATGSTGYGWDAKTHLLLSVTKPDGSTTSVAARDPITDGILQIAEGHGTLQFSQGFRYDGLERLSKSWDSIGAGTEETPDESYAYQYATANQPAWISTTTMVDMGTNSALVSMDLETATGALLTRAHRVPNGWAFDEMRTEIRSLEETDHWMRPALVGGVDPTTLDYSGLATGREMVASEHASSLGFPADSLRYLHDDVTRATHTQVSVQGGTLQRVDLENGSLPESFALDVGQRVTDYVDQGQVNYVYEYDALDRLRVVRLPDGSTHRIDVDDYGRDAHVSRSGIGTIDYSYDATTGLLSTTKYSGNDGQLQRQSTFRYDSVGRKRTRVDALASGTSLTFEWFYDGATPSAPTSQSTPGLLTAIAGDGFVKLFTYRADGRLATQITQLVGWRTVETDLAYAENGASKGHTTTVRDATDAVLWTTQIADSYDAYGRVSAVTLGGSNLATLGYDDNGLLDTAAFADGSTVQLTYDSLTRAPLGMSQTTSAWVTENLVRFNSRALLDTETVSAGTTSSSRQYSYSARRFLTRAADATSNYGYAYDGALGLLTSVSGPGTAGPIARGNGTFSAASGTYGLDTLGRVTSAGNVQLTYGPDGQVASANVAGATWTFKYDEEGRRLLKLSNGQPVAAYLGEGYLDAAQSIETLKFANTAVGVIQNGVFSMVPLDRRGTLLGDANGSAWVPSPYGERATHPALAAAVDYVLQGWDSDLGIVRMGVRDYDPRIGQFWTPDPLFFAHPDRCRGSPTECSLYGYAVNDPVLATDPSGMAAEWVHDTLNVASFFPVVGGVADAAHSLVYLSEGKIAAAVLSAAIAVPFLHEAGEVVKAAKALNEGTHVAMVVAERVAAHGMAEVGEKATVERVNETAAERAEIATTAKATEGPTTAERAAQLTEAIPAKQKGRITMGVGLAEDATGARRVLIGTSEPGGYLRPGVTLAPGETVAAGMGHAEADIVAHAQANGLQLLEVGATRPICSSCAELIEQAGATPVTPLKGGP